MSKFTFSSARQSPSCVSMARERLMVRDREACRERRSERNRDLVDVLTTWLALAAFLHGDAGEAGILENKDRAAPVRQSQRARERESERASESEGRAVGRVQVPTMWRPQPCQVACGVGSCGVWASQSVPNCHVEIASSRHRVIAPTFLRFQRAAPTHRSSERMCVYVPFRTCRRLP